VVLDAAPLDRLLARAAAVRSAGAARVVIGPSAGIDPLTCAGALAGTGAFGVFVELGRGRAASVLARELITLDHLSGGTLVVVLRPPRADAERQLGEALGVLHALFTQEVANFSGTTVTLHDAASRPLPIQPGGPALFVLDAQPGGARIRPAGPEGISPSSDGAALEVLRDATLLSERLHGARPGSWCWPTTESVEELARGLASREQAGWSP